MNRLKKISLFCLIFLLTGCEGSCFQADITRKKLTQLYIGITKEQVIELAGNPYQTKAQSNTELLLYMTGCRSLPRSHYETEPIFTPLLFVDGKLTKWGQDIAEYEDVSKYELKIR